jgi:hypothetical protein
MARFGGWRVTSRRGSILVQAGDPQPREPGDGGEADEVDRVAGVERPGSHERRAQCPLQAPQRDRVRLSSEVNDGPVVCRSGRRSVTVVYQRTLRAGRGAGHLVAPGPAPGRNCTSS